MGDVKGHLSAPGWWQQAALGRRRCVALDTFVGPPSLLKKSLGASVVGLLWSERSPNQIERINHKRSVQKNPKL
jgi:hypothetical protein